MAGPGRLRAAALYVGAFLGPFGGGMVASILPEIGHSFRVSASTATSAITVYLVPFAGLMLVSGTIGERVGRGRAIGTAYLVYAAASLLAVVAPSLPVLLVARALQGTANAFTTPLLIAALADATPPERLGRALGRYSAVAALGQTGAPLIGGLAAEADWRYAFAGSALAAGLLALLPPRTGPKAVPSSAASPVASPPAVSREPAARPAGGGGSGALGGLRALWQPVVLRFAGIAGLTGLCLAGLAFLAAARARDEFGLGSSARGLLLTGFGVVGLVAGPVAGRLVDRLGARNCALAGCLLGTVLVATLGVAPSWPVLAVTWSCCGLASQLVLVATNALTLRGVTTNRGGALSVVQALRFGGSAFAPPLWLPAYGVHPWLGFLLPAVVLGTGGAALLRSR